MEQISTQTILNPSEVDFGFTFERIYHGMGKLGHVISFMFPPFLYKDLSGWTEILYAIAETVAMAFMGTLMASFASLFLGFLGAKNIMPHWLFHFTMRRGFDILRALEQLILALIFYPCVWFRSSIRYLCHCRQRYGLIEQTLFRGD